VLFYRADLYEQKGPEGDPRRRRAVRKAKAAYVRRGPYGMVQRGARGPSEISYDWWPYFNGHGGECSATAMAGDYFVTINRAQAGRASTNNLKLAKDAGPTQHRRPEPGAVNAAWSPARPHHAMMVIAAWGRWTTPTSRPWSDKIQGGVAAQLPQQEERADLGLVAGRNSAQLPAERQRR